MQGPKTPSRPITDDMSFERKFLAGPALHYGWCHNAYSQNYARTLSSPKVRLLLGGH